MAKKKEEAVVEISHFSPRDTLNAILKAKKYDMNILVAGSLLIDNPPEVISISPKFDKLLNGGITSSSWINIVGPPKFGKTTLALRMAAQAQKKGYFVLYVNAEHRLKKMNLEGTAGLDYSEDKFMILQSSAEKILNGQDFLNIIEDVLKSFDKVFCIIDSISTLSHPKQMEEGTGTHTRGGMGVLVSQFVNNCAPIVCQKHHIMAVIQQQYSNTSGYGKTKLAGGGTKVVYQGDCILECKSKSELKSGEKTIGQEVEWVCECSSLGTIPFTKINSYIRYGVGIDCELELVSMAKELGLLAGSVWFTYKEHKYQGIENWAKKLKEDRTLYDELFKDVMTMYEESENEI